MAKLNGKTPEQIAHEIIAKATEPIFVELSGTSGQDLEELIRYKFSKKIYSKGEKWFRDRLKIFRTDYLEAVIAGQIKSRRKLDEEQQQADNLEYYKVLVSRGMAPMEAWVEAGFAPKMEKPAKKTKATKKEKAEAREELDRVSLPDPEISN